MQNAYALQSWSLGVSSSSLKQPTVRKFHHGSSRVHEAALIISTGAANAITPAVVMPYQTTQSGLQPVSTKLFDLNNPIYWLCRPIAVVLEPDSEGFIAVSKELGLYGQGEDEGEALDELKLEIVELYEDLEATPDSQLGTEPARWKTKLRAVIVKARGAY